MRATQCFICREWSHMVSKSLLGGAPLCLPCYVDVLEVRQARGVMGELPGSARVAGAESAPPGATTPGNSPSPYIGPEFRAGGCLNGPCVQADMFLETCVPPTQSQQNEEGDPLTRKR